MALTDRQSAALSRAALQLAATTAGWVVGLGIVVLADIQRLWIGMSVAIGSVLFALVAFNMVWRSRTKELR